MKSKLYSDEKTKEYFSSYYENTKEKFQCCMDNITEAVITYYHCYLNKIYICHMIIFSTTESTINKNFSITSCLFQPEPLTVQTLVTVEESELQVFF